MSEKTYRIADDGVIVPICQKCMKSTSFYLKEYPYGETGCQCTNPTISQVAKNLQNKRLAKLEIVGMGV